MEEPVHRFLPQLDTNKVDTTGLGTSPTAPKRRFAPQLIESNNRSSKRIDGADTSSKTPIKEGRIKPQLIETTKEHRGGKAVRFHDDDLRRPRKPVPAATIPALETNTKKFRPQLIETAKRSFRQNDPNSPSGSLTQSRNRIRIAGWNGPLRPRPPHEEDSRFSYANLVRRREKRQHSFRVPDLPAIRSNSSDESFPSSLSSSAASPPFTTEDILQNCDVRIQSHEHTHDSIIDVDFYSLPARTRDKLLREQALAAFPNEQVYQPVSHFAIDREDGDDTADEDNSVGIVTRSQSLVTRFRRESSVDLTWELEEMRRHKEESEMRERERRFASQRSPFSAAALAARRTADDMHFVSGIDYDAPKRRAVRPPMLGNDIIFPQCESPQTTRCEVDNAVVSNGEASELQPSPLWAPEAHVDLCAEPGLWHGTCKKPSVMDIVALPSPQLAVPGTQPSSVAPRVTTADSACTLAVPTPESVCAQPKKKKQQQQQDEQSCEEDILREFNDSFVTQIYNYLSLGYPCLARDYDEELSIVTGIPVEELRKEDQLANAKGYLGAPERPFSEDQDGMCMRWMALKLYIHEWARRQPRSTNPESGLEGWGVRARGSWAV